MPAVCSAASADNFSNGKHRVFRVMEIFTASPITIGECFLR